MKLINLIKKMQRKYVHGDLTREDIAQDAGISIYSLNNLVHQDREVLELADGNYILVSKHTKIFKLK